MQSKLCYHAPRNVPCDPDDLRKANSRGVCSPHAVVDLVIANTMMRGQVAGGVVNNGYDLGRMVAAM